MNLAYGQTRFRCAGKVFIVGEYACIEGGPAIVTTVAPEFSLRVTHDSSQRQHKLPFADQSPAGLYLSTKRSALEGVRLEWVDPYAAPIGVGSSSAQFLLSVAAVADLEGSPKPTPAEILKLYWETVDDTQGIRPSGVDVVAQWVGGPLVVINEPFSSRPIDRWSGNAAFVMAFTGTKAKTHEHLKDLAARGFPKSYRPMLHRLNAVTTEAIKSWETRNERILGLSLNRYQQILAEASLAPADFMEKLTELQKWPGVLGCKGTGAQGGDCVLFLVEPRVQNDILKRIHDQGWQPIVPEWAFGGATHCK